MKMLVLGATGRTGIQIIQEATKKGHQIVAIARNPQKLADFRIDIVQGTPYDYETVEKAMDGCDAVINTLNVSRKSDNPWAPLAAPKDLISRSAANALKAMEKAGIRRIVVLSTIGAGRSWKTSPGALKFLVTISNLRFAFADHGRQEKLLENSSMDYTICRAPMLSMEANQAGATGTPEGEIPSSRYLSRNAAARFFINIIENNEYISQTINLANKPQ